MVDTVLTKPIRSEHLRDCVAGLMGRSRAPRVRRPLKRSEPPGESGARVLVADDNLINQQVTAGFLEELGCVVRLAGNGEQAVALVREESFDLVLMDCMMPLLDGYDATAAIRQLEAATPARRRIPVVALTAAALQGDRERCLAAGMDDFLTKPLALADLRAKVAQWASTSTTGPEVVAAPLGARQGRAVLDQSVLRQLRFPGADGVCMLTKLIATFMATTPDRLTALANAVARRDAGEVGLIAHTLKTSCAWLGAGALSGRFRELEEAAREGDTDSWEPTLAAIQREYRPVVAALQSVSDAEEMPFVSSASG